MSYQQRQPARGALRDMIPGAATGSLSTNMILGQVMFLVAVAIAFLAGGAYIGRNMSPRAGELFFFGAFGLVLAQNFTRGTLRQGSLGMTVLFGIGLLLGLGLGPVLHTYTETGHGGIVYRAAGGTALTVAAMGCYGYLTSTDILRWLRPVVFAFLGVIVVSWVLLLIGSGAQPVLQVIIYLLSAALLAMYMQMIRRGATENDVVWIATGVFIQVVNIFLVLLSLFGGGGRR
ncbi:MAG TPA: Bax inhibitor-1 family protein [Solirubrobacteraceae bacterium]|jgi:FtsH-binding integral membrane protein|nr:Bax inhibitor-1 family protein [Solirubrobacteraceae bacterium]